jgi:hypothetical protein
MYKKDSSEVSFGFKEMRNKTNTNCSRLIQKFTSISNLNSSVSSQWSSTCSSTCYSQTKTNLNFCSNVKFSYSSSTLNKEAPTSRLNVFDAAKRLNKSPTNMRLSDVAEKSVSTYNLNIQKNNIDELSNEENTVRGTCFSFPPYMLPLWIGI